MNKVYDNFIEYMRNETNNNKRKGFIPFTWCEYNKILRGRGLEVIITYGDLTSEVSLWKKPSMGVSISVRKGEGSKDFALWDEAPLEGEIDLGFYVEDLLNITEEQKWLLRVNFPAHSKGLDLKYLFSKVQKGEATLDVNIMSIMSGV